MECLTCQCIKETVSLSCGLAEICDVNGVWEKNMYRFLMHLVLNGEFISMFQLIICVCVLLYNSKNPSGVQH